MDLRESIDQICDQGSEFPIRFYKLLFERVPVAEAHFENTALKKQYVMLTVALHSVKDFPDLRPAMEDYLRLLGTAHKTLGVDREPFPEFIQVLLETAAEFHADDWDEHLAGQWSRALDRVEQLMLEGYETHFHA